MAESMKERVLEAVRQLPADATVEDAMERLYFLAKIERGVADADAGRVVPHAEVKRRFSLP
jgi:toxin ParE1/3/4